MKIEQALQYLETTARVSCPQITCDQAREIAELMRDLSWKTYAQVLHERDEAQAKLREVERERWAEIDCGQPDICAKAPGCQKHWALRASELAKECDEARAKLRGVEQGVILNEVGKADRLRRYHAEHSAILSRQHDAIEALIDERDYRERDGQIACGFAWDAGREMARLENPHDEADRNVQRAAQTWSKGRGVTVFVDPPEVGEDFDADDYAKPGKR